MAKTVSRQLKFPSVEYAITNDWSVRAEYRYSNFGHITDYPFLNPNAAVAGYFAAQHYLTENQVEVGFSYRFDMMVPPSQQVAAQ